MQLLCKKVFVVELLKIWYTKIDSKLFQRKNLLKFCKQPQLFCLISTGMEGVKDMKELYFLRPSLVTTK